MAKFSKRPFINLSNYSIILVNKTLNVSGCLKQPLLTNLTVINLSVAKLIDLIIEVIYRHQSL